MKIIDTTIAIDHLRGLQAAVELMTRLAEEGETLAASELVRFELLAGVRPNETSALEQFFTSLGWLSIDETIARTAGAFAREYSKAYSGIDTADYVIAATTTVCDADLLTTNVRHFPMLPDLEPPY